MRPRARFALKLAKRVCSIAAYLPFRRLSLSPARSSLPACFLARPLAIWRRDSGARQRLMLPQGMPQYLGFFAGSLHTCCLLVMEGSS